MAALGRQGGRGFVWGRPDPAGSPKDSTGAARGRRRRCSMSRRQRACTLSLIACLPNASRIRCRAVRTWACGVERWRALGPVARLGSGAGRQKKPGEGRHWGCEVDSRDTRGTLTGWSSALCKTCAHGAAFQRIEWARRVAGCRSSGRAERRSHPPTPAAQRRSLILRQQTSTPQVRKLLGVLFCGRNYAHPPPRLEQSLAPDGERDGS
jgi:hypothetical protein